ncbi:hypothetical protein FS749_012038 [Ceratobasidium sp. UAMH 11750]|nr:hypothetical protein FS749_012038 [Ceratobasidium sp. UAMH 11750]
MTARVHRFSLSPEDLDYFIGTFECPLCLDSCNLALAKVAGKCGHVFCQPCLDNLSERYLGPTQCPDEWALLPHPCPSCKRDISPADELALSVRPVHNNNREGLEAQLAVARQKNEDLRRQIDAIKAQAQMYASLSSQMKGLLDGLEPSLRQADVSPDSASSETSR